MIKLGNDFFNPAAIEAIVRSTGDDSYIFLLASKISVACHVGKDELETALISAGLLPSPDADEPEGIPLTEAQRHELAGLYRIGYLYIAKDLNGCSYAFCTMPVKSGAYWNAVDDVKPQRLTEDYDFLDFEDAGPAYIPTVLDVAVPPDKLFRPEE